MRALLGPVVVSLLAVGCGSAPATLSQTDLDAIRAASKSYEQAATRADFSVMAKTFEADGLMLPANAPLLNGVQKIEKWARALPPITKLTLEPIEIVGDGATAWARGRYSLAMAAPGQPEMADTGKYLELWRKQADGSWKIYRDIFNSDLPVLTIPPPPAAPAPPSGK